MGAIRAFGEDGVEVSRFAHPHQPVRSSLAFCTLVTPCMGQDASWMMADLSRIAYEQAQAQVRPTAYELANWVSVN